MSVLKRFTLLLIVILALALTAFNQAPNQLAASPTHLLPPNQEEEPLDIVFVTHDLGAGIFAPVRTGMEARLRHD